jgi:Sulfotransferase domain
MFKRNRKKIEQLDFILAGAQKSGTTALHYFLEKHPQITLGDQQEMHFFDDEKNFSRAIDHEILHPHYSPVPASTIAGECTPSYLYWPPAAERIHQYNSAIKLLFLLRNPVDRAFAHWNMQRFKKREALEFLDALQEEKSRTARPLSLEARRFSYVDRGFFAKQLKRFFALFPREQLKIIKFEEFRNKQRETLEAVFQFLGVKSPGPFRSKDRNVVPYAREMTAAERKHVYAIFAEEICDLERLLGWDCSDWKI